MHAGSTPYAACLTLSSASPPPGVMGTIIMIACMSLQVGKLPSRGGRGVRKAFREPEGAEQFAHVGLLSQAPPDVPRWPFPERPPHPLRGTASTPCRSRRACRPSPDVPGCLGPRALSPCVRCTPQPLDECLLSEGTAKPAHPQPEKPKLN